MDLGVSMGLGRGTTDPSFVETLDHIVASCRAHGVVPGIHANPQIAQDRLDRGFEMVVTTTDLTAMRTNLVDALSIGRGTQVADEGAGGGY